jgi:hypothetical protein
MKRFRALLPLTLFLLTVGRSEAQSDDRWSGFLALDARVFPEGPLFTQQSPGDASVAVQVEYSREWDGGRQSFVATPFGRLDAQDPQRTHFDVRELSWRYAAESWELRAGFRKVFWGVVESYHLVDVINQTDLVEDIDGEQKLGQPMVNFAWIRPWGTIDAFLLAGFRERTFPGPRGRLRFPVAVDEDRTVYQSSAGQKHLDWALRWSKSLGPWDIGLAHFSGTSRDPIFTPVVDGSGAPALVPYYELTRRTSLDLQLTHEDALYKLEAVHHRGGLGSYVSAIGGIEYTFSGFLGSRADLGVLGEYMFSQKGVNVVHPFEDDVFLGTRIQFNDVDSTQVLAGVILDRKTGAGFFNLEASRRIGSSWTLSLKARAFASIPESDLLYGFRLDDYLQIGLALHF